MTIDKSGAFAVNKELEPLGQEVKTVEPPNDDQPDYSSTMYSASEAEWQCQTAVATGKDFFEQPSIASRRRGKARISRPFHWKSLLSGNTEHNPTRINAGERKPPPLKYASSVSLATTIKPSAASNGADLADDHEHAERGRVQLRCTGQAELRGAVARRKS